MLLLSTWRCLDSLEWQLYREIQRFSIPDFQREIDFQGVLCKWPGSHAQRRHSMTCDFTWVSDPMLMMSTLGTAYLLTRLQNALEHAPRGRGGVWHCAMVSRTMPPLASTMT